MLKQWNELFIILMTSVNAYFENSRVVSVVHVSRQESHCYIRMGILVITTLACSQALVIQTPMVRSERSSENIVPAHDPVTSAHTSLWHCERPREYEERTSCRGSNSCSTRNPHTSPHVIVPPCALFDASQVYTKLLYDSVVYHTTYYVGCTSTLRPPSSSCRIENVSDEGLPRREGATVMCQHNDEGTRNSWNEVYRKTMIVVFLKIQNDSTRVKSMNQVHVAKIILATFHDRKDLCSCVRFQLRSRISIIPTKIRPRNYETPTCQQKLKHTRALFHVHRSVTEASAFSSTQQIPLSPAGPPFKSSFKSARLFFLQNRTKGEPKGKKANEKTRETSRTRVDSMAPRNLKGNKERDWNNIWAQILTMGFGEYSGDSVWYSWPLIF